MLESENVASVLNNIWNILMSSIRQFHVKLNFDEAAVIS